MKKNSQIFVAGQNTIEGKSLIDWGGGQRWLTGVRDELLLRTRVESVGGHATKFRGGNRTNMIYHPLAPEVATLHRSLKSAFDPGCILNPGRLYYEI